MRAHAVFHNYLCKLQGMGITMKNFSVSGDFGQVKLGPVYFRSDGLSSLDHIDQCGWHCVNDLYCIDGPDGVGDYLLIFTIAGKGEVFMHGRTFVVEKDTLFIIPPGTPCRYYAPPKCEWEFDWIHISGDNAHILINNIINTAGERIDIQFSAFQDYFKLILDSKYKGIESELFAAKMISKILFAVLYTIHEGNIFNNRNDTVDSAIEYIEDNCMVPFSLARISEKFFISEEHFIRIFKQRTGMTPYRYYRHLKIIKSAYALEYTDAPFSEIADSIGYSSVTSFSIQFKKEMKLSPMEYRKRHKHYQN